MDQGALGDLYHRSVTIAYTYLFHCFINASRGKASLAHMYVPIGCGVGMGTCIKVQWCWVRGWEIQYIVKILRFGVGEGDMK